MAARLAPDNVRRTHQSLHHLVAEAPWNDEEMLAEVRRQVLPAMQKRSPVVAWIVRDTGFPKQGKHSVGVARQECGQSGGRGNCQAAVSLSVSTWDSSLPIAWRLYLPEEWRHDPGRCRQAGVPEGTGFRSKAEIALEQIRQAVSRQVPGGVVLAEAGCGGGALFRQSLTQLGLLYVVGVEPSSPVWMPGRESLPAPARSVRQLALGLPASSWKPVGWRQGGHGTLHSRFAAVRVRPERLDVRGAEPDPEEWLLVEWPKGDREPARYWLSSLAEEIPVQSLVKMAKLGWVAERDHEELKQELGLGHYEGRGWRGFHHHATLCIAAYGFLVSERNRFSSSARAGRIRLPAPDPPPDFLPRGSPRATRALPRRQFAPRAGSV